MEKEKEQTLVNVSETVTEKPDIIAIDVKPKGWFHRLRMKLKLAPLKHNFEIKPQRVINVHRIAGRAVKLDVEEFLACTDMYMKISLFNKIMAFNADDIFYITATAIQNNHKEPSRRMLNIVKNDFEIEDLYTVFLTAISNYNIASFSNSIALITGVDILKPKKASPMESGV